MTGTTLVRLAADGRVSLCDLRDGEPYAQTVIAPRVGAPPSGLLAGGGSLPPVAILTDGADRLTAIDLRNGELRWRAVLAGPGAVELRRAGRVLCVTRGDSAVSALDIASGELLWRFARAGARFSLAPAIDGDVVIAASGEPGKGAGALYGIDLFSGRARWDRALDAAPSSAPLSSPGVTTMAIGGPRRASLAAFSAEDGELRWMIPDPGAAGGAACLSLDRTLIVNAAGGVSAIGLDDGQTRWQRRLSHPVADDVPRRLEAVLRGGALFVPSAEVHVLRPQDGRSIGDPLPCELVPDWMRVDERGWVYVAEESGHLRALAPRPHLSLVR
jgi:outer membrane protein assembly factor BamB